MQGRLVGLGPKRERGCAGLGRGRLKPKREEGRKCVKGFCRAPIQMRGREHKLGLGRPGLRPAAQVRKRGQAKWAWRSEERRGAGGACLWGLRARPSGRGRAAGGRTGGSARREASSFSRNFPKAQKEKQASS